MRRRITPRRTWCWSPMNLDWKAHGLTFTIGRGNEVVVAAVEALKPLVIGRALESITGDMAGFWRDVTGDSQLRWLGPEKGVIHLATAAIVNAVWDLYAKFEGKPLWKLLADMSPHELVACIDFRYIADVLTPDGGSRPAATSCRDKVGTSSVPAGARLPDVHHLGRLAGIFG